MLAAPLSCRAARVHPPYQKGVALLEALIAIVIFSLGILGLIGLQATSTKAATQAKFRIDASQVASQRISEIWVDQANMASYAESDSEVPSLPDGKRTTTVSGTEVTVTVSWSVPGVVDAAGDPVSNSYVAIAQVAQN